MFEKKKSLYITLPKIVNKAGIKNNRKKRLRFFLNKIQPYPIAARISHIAINKARSNILGKLRSRG
jgi:hypothetical protein